MSVCKICLCSDPIHDITQLKSTDNIYHNGEYILLFCLGIQVVQGSENNTKLCETCSVKLLEFHHFKCRALKNEATLSFLGLQKYAEHTIKSEVLSQTSDDNNCYDEPLIDYSELQDGKLLEEISTEHTIDINVLPAKKEKLSETGAERQQPKTKKNCQKFGVTKKITKSKELQKSKKNTSFSCNECGKVLKNKYVLIHHLEVHKPREQRKNHECAHCCKQFISKRTLADHIIKHHPVAVSEDVRQGKGGKQTGRGRRRSKTPKIHECATCKRQFVTNCLLRRHLSVHSNVKPFSCNLCDAKFRLNYSVALHKAQVHEKSKNHFCHMCPKRFFTASLLRRHIKKHSETVDIEPKPSLVPIKREVIKTVECPDCGKPLASQRTLRQHRLLHRGGKNHCPICGLGFATHTYVTNHLKTHMQERKYNCKFCQASFVRSGARRRHELEVHINAGQKKPPRKTPRKRASRKKVKPEVPKLATVMVSIPEQLVQPQQDFPTIHISGPLKKEQSMS